MSQDVSKRSIKFTLSRETVRELNAEELDLVWGGVGGPNRPPTRPGASVSCCTGCTTDGSTTWCSGQGPSC
jgi:hypothetical protein